MAEGNGGRGTGLRRLVGRWITRVAEVLPSVRSRLFALVGLTLVPALVILGYDEWQARQRGLEAFADVSTRVVRLMRLDLDGRITRAGGRLSTLAAEPEVVSVGPLAGRRLVDAFRDDRLYNNLMIVDGASGDLRVSAVPFEKAWSARHRPAYQRAKQLLDLGIGAFIREPATGLSGLNIAQPALDERGRVASVVFASLSMAWVDDFIESSGLPGGTVLTIFDDQGIVQYRSAEADKYVGRKGALASVLGDAGAGRTEVTKGVDGVERLYAAVDVEFHGQRTGSVAALGIPLGPWRAVMNHLLLQNLAIFAAGTLLSFLMAWLVSELLIPARDAADPQHRPGGLAEGNLEGRTGLGPGRGEMLDLARALDDGISSS